MKNNGFIEGINMIKLADENDRNQLLQLVSSNTDLCLDEAYSGARQPECDMEFINYESQYFEQYVEMLRRSFYEMRKCNDFEPYNCCEPDDAKRKELEENKDSIYLLMEDGKLAASVIINKNKIDDVFVVPDYQGKGIGRKLMQFAINKVIDSGNDFVELSAIAWNQRALHLYESVGFNIVKAIHYLRFLQ